MKAMFRLVLAVAACVAAILWAWSQIAAVAEQADWEAMRDG